MKCCMCNKKRVERKFPLNWGRLIQFSTRLRVKIQLSGANGLVCSDCCKVMFDRIIESGCLQQKELFKVVGRKE